ncbi:MAG: hypothetical protein AAFO94_13670, partial [Bacteroidota bacterium]
MIFLESTHFFVRTVAFEFVNRDPAVRLRFRLMPMIHVGSAQYYEQVFDYLNECDEVLYEGVRSKKRSFSSYYFKWVAKRLGLVSQTEALPLRKLKGRLIHADYSQKENEQQIALLSTKERLYMRMVLPFRRILDLRESIQSRAMLAKCFMTSAEDAYRAYGPVRDEPGTYENYLLHQREQIVFDHIRQKMRTETALPKLVGIIYGAGHMDAIARYLIDQYHFVPAEGRFFRA